MRVEETSYRFAGSVLRDEQFKKSADEIRKVLRDLQPALYAPELAKIRTRNSNSIQAFPVNQKEMNKRIEEAMPAGWELHPLVVKKSNETKGPTTNIKADFKKSRIQLEVQFGNMARWYTDVFKFQLAYSLDSIDVGVLVVPKQRFANLIDENVASYERVLRELPWAKMSLTLPILVIGIEPDSYAPIKACYEKAGQFHLAKKSKIQKESKVPTLKLRPFNDAIKEEELDK